MVRLLTFLALVFLGGAAQAQETAQIPLGNRTSEVFELTPEAPVHTFHVSVGNVQSLAVTVLTPTVPVDVDIVDPSGASLGPAVLQRFSLAPAEVPALGALLFGEGHHVQATITTPLAGQWTVHVTLPPHAPETLGSITTVITGGVNVAALTSRPSYTLGQTVSLAMLAFNGQAPVPNATVTGHVSQLGAESAPLPVTLRDDGVTPDAVAGDGVYTTSLEALPVGHYLAKLVLLHGEAQAIAGVDFEVSPSLARFSGSVSDVGVDTNSDGLFEFIQVRLGVHVDVPGTYEVLANLQLPSGASISSGTRATLTAGEQTLTIPFSATDIRQYLAADGPWLIRDVRLVEVASIRGTDHREDFGATSAYPLSKLQRPLTLILPGLTESVVDTNGNGFFDALHVNIRVDTLQAGSYTWTGELRALNGALAGAAQGQGYVASGTSSIRFTFEGKELAASGLDGPYKVGNLAIYGPTNAAAVLEKAGTTRAYRAVLFEGSQLTVDRLREEIQGLLITGRGGVPRGEEIRTQLLRQVDKARSEVSQGKPAAVRNSLAGLITELRAHTGKHIDPSDVERLTRLIESISSQQ